MLNFLKLNYSQARVWDLRAKIKVVKGKLRKPITTFFHHFSGIFDNRRRGVLLDSTPLKSHSKKIAGKAIAMSAIFSPPCGWLLKFCKQNSALSLERVKSESCRNPIGPFLPHFGAFFYILYLKSLLRVSSD